MKNDGRFLMPLRKGFEQGRVNLLESVQFCVGNCRPGFGGEKQTARQDRFPEQKPDLHPMGSHFYLSKDPHNSGHLAPPLVPSFLYGGTVASFRGYDISKVFNICGFWHFVSVDL